MKKDWSGSLEKLARTEIDLLTLELHVIGKYNKNHSAELVFD